MKKQMYKGIESYIEKNFAQRFNDIRTSVPHRKQAYEEGKGDPKMVMLMLTMCAFYNVWDDFFEERKENS